MNTSVNTNNIESKNGMSQVINILTGETKKIRCHYISHRTDKPVSRVLTLERLNHPALTAAGVTAWAERFNDGVNSFDWLRVSIQLTDKICYTPNCANVGLPDVENYGNLDYYMGQEGAMRVSMNNVDKFFQSIADKPAKMMTGEDWPNMAVIAAYRAAGHDEEADTLTAARDTYNARKEADKEAWSKKYAAQQYYYNSPKPKNFDELTELERAQFMMQTAQECAKDYPELDWADVLEKAEKRLEKAKTERQERYNARCKELETETLAQMPYKVGDTVKSRYGETGRVIEMHPEITGDIDSPHLVYEYDGKPLVNVVILDADGKRHCAHWSFFTLQETSEITEFFTKGKKYRCIKSVKGNKSGRETFTKGQVYEQYTEPSVFYGWLRNNQGERHAWPQIDEIADYLETWPDTKPEDIDPRLYFEPVEDTRETEDIREAEGVKVGDKVRHNKHEEVATVTAIRKAFMNGCDGYRYLYTLDFGQSVKGPFDVELNGGEFLREAFTLQEAPEIKPKAAFQIGDRVERKSDGERGTVDDYGVTDDKLTYIVKYDRTRRRQSDGFEYMSEELYGDELQTDAIESRKRTIIARAKQDKQTWHYYKGYEVRVRKAYTNDSSDPENWTYRVSWYADEQLVECENGVRLEQAAKALNDLPRWAEARKAA